jgi:hypothetical protein
MNTSDRWSLSLYIAEIDSQTHAEARLVMPGGDELTCTRPRQVSRTSPTSGPTSTCNQAAGPDEADLRALA